MNFPNRISLERVHWKRDRDAQCSATGVQVKHTDGANFIPELEAHTHTHLTSKRHAVFAFVCVFECKRLEGNGKAHERARA